MNISEVCRRATLKAARNLGSGALAVVFVTGSLGAGAAVITATPAAAYPGGVSCYGDYCSGQDPQATNCGASAYNLASANVGAGELDLRWSPVCKTEWARLYVYPTKTLAPGFIYALQSGTGYRTNAQVSAITSLSAQSPTYWTPMIYSPVRCVTANFDYYPGYAWNVQSTVCR
jgi:hypothetical protein